jgi:pimeloyl-ACP methyl ester carboxylesterase
MPQFETRDGCTLHYELRGSGPLVTLTPGGREPGRAVAALANALAAEARVLTWDRRNAGASDLFFGGELSEAEVWAEDLADLIDHLGEGPAWIAGGSAGCRTSVLTALRRPEAARGLLLWSASGGEYACQFLGFSYHVPYIMAAQAGGMEAVAKSPFFAERIAENPANRDRLLAFAPDAFIAAMKRLNRAFYFKPDETLTGVPDAALEEIAIPTLIFEGNDDIHAPEVARRLADLVPAAKLLPSPWSNEEWLDKFTGRAGGSVFDLYPKLAPAILEFIGASG